MPWHQDVYGVKLFQHQKRPDQVDPVKLVRSRCLDLWHGNVLLVLLLFFGLISDGKNLVYSAPTSAGKSLVAEILLLKKILKTKKKCVYILPYISLARYLR